MSSFISMTNLIYPVGSYYMSNSSTSPASLFGGSWTQITSRFLYGYTSITTGGSSSHTHSYGIQLHEASSCIASTGYDIGMAHLYNYSNSSTWTAVGTQNIGIISGTYYTNNIGSRNTLTQVARQAITANASYSSTLPSYRTCYMWYRTS